MANVTVRYFATLREHRGCAEEQIAFSEPVTVGELFARIFADTAVPRVAYARNRDLVSPDTPLADGDEVAFLPPVGGG